MAERARIARYFAPLAQGEPGSFNLTDDAAVLMPPAGFSLVVTTDSVIENIHVLPNATPKQFAQKLMRRNLSDLAAMGATPWRYTLNLHTPHGLDDAWFAAFARALLAEQTAFDLLLVGGDSTSGDPGAPVHATMTCLGLVRGPALRRSGAKAGDDIYVSGTTGDAAMALRLLQQNTVVEEAFLQRYHAPEPRLALGGMLRTVASAAIDISDGLCADMLQLCAASHVGAQVNRDAILRSPTVQHFLERDAGIWNLVLNGGDDYELCFTAPVAARERVTKIAQTLALPLTRIGEIVTGSGVVVTDASGAVIEYSNGWEHA